MNVILQQPATVLVVSTNTNYVNQIREALSKSTTGKVVHESSADEALTFITDEESVGCVIADETVADITSFRAALADTDRYLPFIFCSSTSKENLMRELTRNGPTTILSTLSNDKSLREIVDESLTTYHKDRITAEESDMLQTMMSEMNVPIFVKDSEGRHLRMTNVPGGVDEDVVIGKTDLEVYSYDYEAAEEFYADDMRVINDDIAIRQKDESSGPQGSKHYARASKVPWPDKDGSNKGLLGISVDITDLKKRAKRADQLEDRLEQFASYVSHDLQNPLNVASGYTQIAKEGDTEALDTVEEALNRIEEMLNDLDYLARQPPENGGAESVEIPIIIRRICSFISTREAEIEIEMPETARAQTSVEELRPLLENLIRNAIVHGGDQVTVRVGTLDDGFYVSDDGVGIPPSKRKKVLQRGYTTAEDGSGTGLAIVSEIVERNGWTLNITESEEGGARFEIHDALVVPDPVIQYTPGESIELDEFTSVPDAEITGGIERDGSNWTLTSGRDIEQQGRGFSFAYTEVSGPVRIQARIQSVEHVNDFSNAGLMIRGGLKMDDSFGFVGHTVGQGVELLYRHNPDNEPYQTFLNHEQPYQWFRLDRIGETLTCSVSVSGDDWKPLDQRRIAFDDPVFVGIMVNSVVPGEPCKAVFSNVEAIDLR
ncbi:ATP-binding protein [Natronoarchaeum mannanilyticum]|uniref:histidine kinase n=1 Tax=Natronoarchaeum mannanilyticum TaxID=926360 RepID=A0AAV3TDK5_9EURY